MPIPITKYTCQFKCGKRAVSDEISMKAHESTCWKNPHNRTCKTCSNEVYESDNDSYKSWICRGCKVPALDDVLQNVEPILKHQNSFHIRPIFHCEYWNKPANSDASEFAIDLLNEIRSDEEGTKHYPFFNKPKKEEAI